MDMSINEGLLEEETEGDGGGNEMVGENMI
jgi:hypothetical protein